MYSFWYSHIPYETGTTDADAQRRLGAQLGLIESPEQKLMRAYKLILEGLNIKETPGTKDTAHRAAKAMLELTSGYQTDIDQILSRTFEEKHDEIVIVKDIGIVSLCEHHLLPFFGKCHIAYIPSKKILGLSKLARLARAYAMRLQVQERLTDQIADSIMKAVKPKGVGVIIEAQHMCMMIRGVKDMDAITTTSAMRGVFLKSKPGKSPKEEMLSLIYRR